MRLLLIPLILLTCAKSEANQRDIRDGVLTKISENIGLDKMDTCEIYLQGRYVKDTQGDYCLVNGFIYMTKVRRWL